MIFPRNCVTRTSWEVFWFFKLEFVGLGVTISSLEFLMGHIGELIELNFMGFIWVSVMFSNEILFLLVNGSSEFEFFNCSVCFSELGDELEEVHLS